jgi:putative DNA modification/repair radical SAM protein
MFAILLRALYNKGIRRPDGDFMDIREKLRILGEAARYDASCASSGSGRQGKAGGLGNAHMSGICHSWSDDGRCISLLKILLSNDCVFNCAYCANRRTADIERATFTPEEIALLTTEFYRRNYIEGLFLSSAVINSPDGTMELVHSALALLRGKYGFCGYIHVKIIPGTSEELVSRIGMLADRVSVNIELPSEESLKLLAPQKQREKILAPMSVIKRLKTENTEERKVFRHAPLFAPAGQSTQMIVGATRDSDRRILTLSSALYGKYNLKRVYFSAYVPVGNHPTLPPPDVRVPLRREHRLYQADWLMRFYEFSSDEITENDDDLDLELDPKSAWAVRHPEFFPVEVNTADYRTLLRVPGIGVRSAQRIIGARKSRTLDLYDLKKLGLVLKRAVYFITCGGKYYGGVKPGSPILRGLLSDGTVESRQTALFDFEPEIIVPVAGLLSGGKPS